MTPAPEPAEGRGLSFRTRLTAALVARSSRWRSSGSLRPHQCGRSDRRTAAPVHVRDDRHRGPLLVPRGHRSHPPCGRSRPRSIACRPATCRRRSRSRATTSWRGWPRATTAWPPTSNGAIASSGRSWRRSDESSATATRSWCARGRRGEAASMARPACSGRPGRNPARNASPACRGRSAPSCAPATSARSAARQPAATRTWERADQDLLDLYASEIGVAIRNAELFDQVEAQNPQLLELTRSRTTSCAASATTCRRR